MWKVVVAYQVLHYQQCNLDYRPGLLNDSYNENHKPDVLDLRASYNSYYKPHLPLSSHNPDYKPDLRASYNPDHKPDLLQGSYNPDYKPDLLHESYRLQYKPDFLQSHEQGSHNWVSITASRPWFACIWISGFVQELSCFPSFPHFLIYCFISSRWNSSRARVRTTV